MVKFAKPTEGYNSNRQVLSEYLRLKKQKPNLDKAIDRPIGQLDRAREDPPIGWDMGPEGPRIVPGLADKAEAQGSESTSDAPVGLEKGLDAPISGKADEAPDSRVDEPGVESSVLGGGGAVITPRATAPIGFRGQGLGAPFYSPDSGAAGKVADSPDSMSPGQSLPRNAAQQTPSNTPPDITGLTTGAASEDDTLSASGQLIGVDPDVGDSAAWSLPTGGEGAYGTLTIDGAGSWIYTLDNERAQGLRAGEAVQEIFTVRVTDSAGATADQQVTITVSGTNDMPVISGSHTAAVAEDSVATASGTLAATDVDIGDSAAWSLPTGGEGAYGTLALDAAGSWTYTLDDEAAQGLKAGETVQEIFTVRVTDGAGATVDQQVTVTVSGTNDVPVISGAHTGTVAEDEVPTVGGTLTSTDVDVGDIPEWSLVGSAESSYGAMALDPTTGQWTYTLDGEAAQGLNAGETVQEIFTVRVTDSAGATADRQVTITVSGTNDMPVISGIYTGAVTEDSVATARGTLAATDVDIGDSAAWSLPTGGEGAYGTLTIDAAGSWIYTLDNERAQGLRAGEAVQEIFTIRVTDSAGATADQQVTVTVSGTNDVPVISGSYIGIVREDRALIASGKLTASDVDVGDTATWSVIGNNDSPYGALSLDPATGQWTYTLNNQAAQGLKAGETVQEIFTVRATDTAGATADQEVSVTVVGTNDNPVISGSYVGAVTEDAALTATGQLTAADVDTGDTAIWSLPNGGDGGYGTLTIDATGHWSYELDNDTAQALKVGQTVQEIFVVRVTDGAGGSADQLVTITVTGTNDEPVISGSHTGAVAEDAAPTASGILTASDVDVGDTANWSIAGSADSPYGALSVHPATGRWTYTLDNQAAQSLKAGETAQEIFTARVTDSAGATADQQVTVTVSGTNDAPAISGTYTGAVAEDTALSATGQLTATDVDIGDTATWAIVGNADTPYGALSLDPATGQWTYTLDNGAAQSLKANQTVQEIFTVRVSDAEGAAVQQQITVTVTGTNDVPVISGTHTGTVVEDTATVADGQLTAADADIGDTATWSIAGNFGLIITDANGGWGYLPDGNGAQLAEGDTVESFVVLTDYGELYLSLEGHWTYHLDEGLSQGLKGGETVQEIVTARVTDSTGATADQQITITITGTNDAPVISGSSTGAVIEDVALSATGQLTASDVDIGDTTTWSIISSADSPYGALSVDAATGQWTYTLDSQATQGLKAGETVQEIFAVRVTDSAGGTAQQQVIVTVNGTNDTPVISGSYTGAVTEDATLIASGKLTATDLDLGDTATWSVVGSTDSPYGMFHVDPGTGRWTYTLDNEAAQVLTAGENAQEIFTVRVTDSAGSTVDQQVTITVNGANDGPSIGGSHTGAVAEDNVLTASGKLIATDPDIGDGVTWSIINNPDSPYGALALDPATGQWTYALDNQAAQSLKGGETVQEIFTVRVTDALGATADDQVTITISGTNDMPVISGTYTGAVAEDGILTATDTLTATDLDIGDTATWSVVGGAARSFGAFTLDPVTGQWTYTLNNDAAQSLKAGQTVQEIFTVRVTDGSGATADQQVTVTVTGTNDTPVISGTYTGAVAEDGTLKATGSLTATDVDVGDTAAWSVVGSSAGSFGAFAIDPVTGQWNYALSNEAAQSLKAGQTVQEIFTVRVTDGSGATTDQQVIVTVTGTNDTPVISGSYTATVAEDSALSASGQLTASDVDIGDNAAWSIVGNPDSPYGALSVDPSSGQWTYTLDNQAAQSLKAGQTVQEIFTVRVTDGSGATADKQVTVTVTGTNDTPVISGSYTGAVAEDTVLTTTGKLTATDTDIGDVVTWSVVGGPDGAYGLLSGDPATGRWIYTLDNEAAQGLKAGETVQETFTVRTTDSAGATADQQVTVTVTGTNDAPVVGQSLGELGTVQEEGVFTFTAADLLNAAQITDVDRDTLTVTDVELDAEGPPGSLTDNQDGTWTYRPGTNVSNVSPQLEFTVSDGHSTVEGRATINVQPVADPAIVSLGADTQTEVIDTGSPAYLGRIVEDTITSGPTNEFTLEFTVLADDVPPPPPGGPGPVIVNVGSANNNNVLTFWNPTNLTLGLTSGANTRNVQTGLDLTDGQSHRITATWDYWSGTLKIYDNGALVTTTWMSPPPSDLYISIAQKPDVPPNWNDVDGSGFRASEHFQGDVYYVTMANDAETSTQVARGPLTEQVAPNRLLVDIRAVNGQIVDTTGHQHLDPQGGLHADTRTVDSSTTEIPAGAILNLDVNLQPTDPNDTVTQLQISGFLAGTVLSDGIRYVTMIGPNQKIDITNWQLDKLTANLPDGVHQNMTLTVEATVTTPPYDTGEVDGNGQPIMTTDSTVVTEQHDIYVEFAPETELLAQTTSEPVAAEPMMMASDTSTDDAAMISGLDESTGTTSETETEPTATDPYLQLTDPTQTQAEPAATTAEPSPTEPYLALTSPPDETQQTTTGTSPNSGSPAPDYTQLATDSGSTSQDPPPADQLYADTQISSSETPDVSTSDAEPLAAPIVPSTQPEDPLASHHN